MLATIVKLPVLIGIAATCLIVLSVPIIVPLVIVRRRRRRLESSADRARDARCSVNDYDITPSTDDALEPGLLCPQSVYANATGDDGAQSTYQSLSDTTRDAGVVYEALKGKTQPAADAAVKSDGDAGTHSDAANVYANVISLEQSVYESLASANQNEPVYTALKNNKRGAVRGKKK